VDRRQRQMCIRDSPKTPGEGRKINQINQKLKLKTANVGE
jgi:hypothetical protein